MQTLQDILLERILGVFSNAQVKKINTDNFLDIHLPDLHEKRGTHLFFNTAKNKIKLGFYCREEEFVTSVLDKSELVERYAQGLRLTNNPEFEEVDSALAAALQLIDAIAAEKSNSEAKTDNDSEDELDWEEDSDDSEEEEEEGGFPMISFRKPAAGMEDVVKQYLMRWQKPSQFYAWRMGIKAFIPEFVPALASDKVCPIFTSREIEAICARIKSEKIIPILDYVPEDLYNHTKRVWWLVPFCIWKEDVASLVFVDKNGFYAMYSKDGEEEIDMVFNWDSVDELDFEYEYDGDPNINRLTLTQEDGNFLTFDEFVSTSEEGNHGSYLSVIEAIWEVRKETIEASKGESFWAEGAGGEGFTSFTQAYELCDEFKWVAEDRPDSELFGGSKVAEEQKAAWPDDFLVAVSMIAGNYFEYAAKYASMDEFHQVLKFQLFDGDWDKFKEAWPLGFELYTSTLFHEIETWEDVFTKINTYFESHIGYASAESEYKLAGVFYDLWLASCRDLGTTYEELKPLYSINFQGSTTQSPPFGYLANTAKFKFEFLSKLYITFGKKHLWKAFISRLENSFQFFQVGYQLINDFNFNLIDADTVRYIAAYRREGSPHINSVLPSVQDFSHAVMDLFKVDKNLCAGLSYVHMISSNLTDIISESEYHKLKNRVRKVSAELKLQVAMQPGIPQEKPDAFYTLPSGKSIFFEIWVLEGESPSYLNYYQELVKDSAYIVTLKNHFAKQLLQDAAELEGWSSAEGEVSAADYLQSNASWQIAVEEFTFPTKCFTGDLRIQHLQDAVFGTGEVKITLSGTGSEFIQGFISKEQARIFQEKYGNSASNWDQFCVEELDLQGYFELPSISHATGILKDKLDLKIEFGENVIFEGNYADYFQKYFAEEYENENDLNLSRDYGKYLPELESTDLLVSVATVESFHYEITLAPTAIFIPQNLGVKYVAVDEFGLGTIDMDLVLGLCYSNVQYDADYPGVGQISFVKLEPEED
jgi:hypothetical protein